MWYRWNRQVLTISYFIILLHYCRYILKFAVSVFMIQETSVINQLTFHSRISCSCMLSVITDEIFLNKKINVIEFRFSSADDNRVQNTLVQIFWFCSRVFASEMSTYNWEELKNFLIIHLCWSNCKLNLLQK